MVLTAVAGTRLGSAEPSDIQFLSSFFTDVSAILARQSDTRMKLEWRNLVSVKCILSEALGCGSVQEGSRAPLQSELDSDTEDETWVESWSVKGLLEWMLLEARRAGLPNENRKVRRELQSLIERLEKRIITTPDTSFGSCTASAGPPKPFTETVTRREPKRRRLANSISMLPTELLCKIFEYVCTPHSLAPFSPLTLSHVDSSFRSIVLDMPSLWSTIDDSFPLPIAKLYLERSLPAPLDIRVGSNGSSAVEDGKVDQLFQYLKPHAYRVKALQIVMAEWEPIIRMEVLMDGDTRFNGLEKLEFGRCDNWHPVDRPLMFKLDEPDSLRELHLWGYELNQWVDRFPTALRLLHLTDAVVRFEDLLVALEHSPGLGVLVLDDCDLFADEEMFITAGGLVELQFIMIDPAQMDLFASIIKMPALTSLSVAANTAPDSNDFLINLLKSSMEILSIEICDYYLTADDWLAVFQHLPSLTHLRVRASYSSEEDLQALIMAQTLPNLTSITLDNELRLTTLFVEQVARAHHPKLESVVLRGWDPSNVSADSLAAISKLVRRILVETFRRSPEEDCDEETESDTSDDFGMDDSWLSGDEHVVRREGNA